MRSVSLREPEILRRLREETSHDPMAGMQISPEQGQFMSMLIKLLGASRTLEVGVFTGYSSLCRARGEVFKAQAKKLWLIYPGISF